MEKNDRCFIHMAVNATYKSIAMLRSHCVFRARLVFTEEVLQLKAAV